MSRRVIILGPLPPPYGGVSIYMSALRKRLAGRARVWAVSSSAGQTSDARDVRFIKHRRLGIVPALLEEGRGGARILDSTHFHLEYPHPLLLPVWLTLKFILRFEWYKNIHDGSLPSRQRQFNFIRRALFRLAIKFVDEFVVVSEELRRWLIDDIKVRQKVMVVPPLLPLAQEETDAQLSTPDALAPYLHRARRVCSAGVFIHDYGFAQVARAVERLREETGEDIGLLLLDGTFARDENYRAETLRGRDWIAVLENVPHPDVLRIFTQSSVFARAFRDESYGLSRVEAISCGLPVVGTRAGETRGMLLYDFGDEDALLRQLRRALFEPDARVDVGQWAEVFRREAEENLRKLTRVLELN